MYQIPNERVSVVTIYNCAKGTVLPYKVRWNNRDFIIDKLGYYHRQREGRNLIHIFHVANNAIAFRLRFDSETLHWTLEEVSDGLGDQPE